MWKLMFVAGYVAVVGGCVDRTEKPKVQGDHETCEVYCSRWIECRDASLVPPLEACTNDCVNSEEWGGPCAEEITEFFECATLPENACPTFEHVGIAGGEAAPCYDENNDYSVCFNRTNP